MVSPQYLYLLLKMQNPGLFPLLASVKHSHGQFQTKFTVSFCCEEIGLIPIVCKPLQFDKVCIGVTSLENVICCHRITDNSVLIQPWFILHA